MYVMMFTAILEAYGGAQASATLRREADVYSINTMTAIDQKLMRRDAQSRGLTSRIDRRFTTD